MPAHVPVLKIGMILKILFMKKVIFFLSMATGCGIVTPTDSRAQLTDTVPSSVRNYKNVVRYNLSGALLFGLDKYVIFGYERVLWKRQSVSINFGKVSLPKLITIDTDSFSLTKDVKNKGTNFSIDWRFYLAKENKYLAPHGLYIGPFYSFNGYKRTNDFSFRRSSGIEQVGTSDVRFNIHTIGGELGYQFILWKRISLDMVLIGPGISSYYLTAKFDGNLNEEDRGQLRDAVQQIITQKFPGMNYVLGDKELNANGILKTWDLGFRYMIHIGYIF
jgi:hypothetical protein